MNKDPTVFVKAEPVGPYNGEKLPIAYALPIQDPERSSYFVSTAKFIKSFMDRLDQALGKSARTTKSDKADTDRLAVAVAKVSTVTITPDTAVRMMSGVPIVTAQLVAKEEEDSKLIPYAKPVPPPVYPEPISNKDDLRQFTLKFMELPDKDGSQNEASTSNHDEQDVIDLYDINIELSEEFRPPQDDVETDPASQPLQPLPEEPEVSEAPQLGLEEAKEPTSNASKKPKNTVTSSEPHDYDGPARESEAEKPLEPGGDISSSEPSGQDDSDSYSREDSRSESRDSNSRSSKTDPEDDSDRSSTSESDDEDSELASVSHTSSSFTDTDNDSSQSLPSSVQSSSTSGPGREAHAQALKAKSKGLNLRELMAKLINEATYRPEVQSDFSLRNLNLGLSQRIPAWMYGVSPGELGTQRIFAPGHMKNPSKIWTVRLDSRLQNQDPALMAMIYQMQVDVAMLQELKRQHEAGPGTSPDPVKPLSQSSSISSDLTSKESEEEEVTFPRLTVQNLQQFNNANESKASADSSKKELYDDGISDITDDYLIPPTQENISYDGTELPGELKESAVITFSEDDSLSIDDDNETEYGSDLVTLKNEDDWDRALGLGAQGPQMSVEEKTHSPKLEISEGSPDSSMKMGLERKEHQDMKAGFEKKSQQSDPNNMAIEGFLQEKHFHISTKTGHPISDAFANLANMIGLLLTHMTTFRAQSVTTQLAKQLRQTISSLPPDVACAYINNRLGENSPLDRNVKQGIRAALNLPKKGDVSVDETTGKMQVPQVGPSGEILQDKDGKPQMTEWAMENVNSQQIKFAMGRPKHNEKTLSGKPKVDEKSGRVTYEICLSGMSFDSSHGLKDDRKVSVDGVSVGDAVNPYTHTRGGGQFLTHKSASLTQTTPVTPDLNKDKSSRNTAP